MAEPRFGFIGAGRMATALARGFLSAGLATAERIVASDPYPTAREQFATETGGRIADSNREVAAAADVIFLAVKPQQMSQVLAELRGHAKREHLVISIAAGVPLAALAGGLGDAPRLVRVMPNTPCLVGSGASGYCLAPNATAEDAALVDKLLGAVGIARRVDESLLDAVTGLSGSGPAFVYVLIEALSDGGVKMGLPRDVALALAAQTVRGAAEMVLATGEHPGALKDAVTSPGGTTIAGLAALEAAGARAAMIAAVEAATRRSTELGALSKSKSV
ncbi:MAG TPA: pyrroline-5-carboxylate reductase [Pirellulales bacterium]|nr:pyrroline-5-carboxylate reductase [Pirellulales bacterium]